MSDVNPFQVLGGDESDDRLISNVHPESWVNPQPAPSYNLVVLGAGTAGLVAAVGAAVLGARVALVEKGLLGGDCLNYGCVPSKALIRSARAAADVLAAGGFGVSVEGKVEVDFAGVMGRLRRLRARISEHDSAARMKSLGVDVFLGAGRFLDGRRVEVAGKILKFARAIVAAGSRPAVPDIPGLAASGFLTNETVFNLERKPKTLAVIGGGPVGCELAQAFARLGSRVTLFQRASRLLPREDPDAAAILGRVFLREGIRCLLNSRVSGVVARDGRKEVHFQVDGREETVAADELLVAAGRLPNVEALGLEAAGVATDGSGGIKVDRFLRSTNKRVFAAGDICYPHKFTHLAEATARIALQNALFFRGKKTSSLTIPWCIYTDPEIARVGPSRADAPGRGGEVRTFVRRLEETDRAIIDGEEEGFVKVHVRGRGRITGATIVARHAGEMISEVTALIAAGKGLRFLQADVIHPYPTQSEAVKRAAARYFEGLLKPWLRRLLARWFAWRR
jgi:pyruvate/2-oxoglutarate dehydrogenase complex dihydrolipoamide dehydrogenase (E3) component